MEIYRGQASRRLGYPLPQTYFIRFYLSQKVMFLVRFVYLFVLSPTCSLHHLPLAPSLIVSLSRSLIHCAPPLSLLVLPSLSLLIPFLTPCLSLPSFLSLPAPLPHSCFPDSLDNNVCLHPWRGTRWDQDLHCGKQQTFPSTQW